MDNDGDTGVYRETLNENALKDGDSQAWKEIQQNTYTRWINVKLNPLNKSVDDLKTGLTNGLNLIALVEVLSGKMILKYNKKPNFRSQKLENISIVFNFLAGEGVFLFNIDSSDIVDGKIKLTLSLLWNIILHYEILLSMKDEVEEDSSEVKKTSKQRLMEWINQKIPQNAVTNFTTNWNDGKALGCLVHSIHPKLCSDWDQWDRKQPIVNATLAMNIAEKRLNVPKILRPDEIVNPKVDEHSIMTYLSQFKKAKFKTGAPKRQKIKDVCKEDYKKILDFLMIAGLDEKILSNPKKAQEVKEWVETHNVYTLMEKKTQNDPLPSQSKQITETNAKNINEEKSESITSRSKTQNNNVKTSKIHLSTSGNQQANEHVEVSKQNKTSSENVVLKEVDHLPNTVCTVLENKEQGEQNAISPVGWLSLNEKPETICTNENSNTNEFSVMTENDIKEPCLGHRIANSCNRLSLNNESRTEKSFNSTDSSDQPKHPTTTTTKNSPQPIIESISSSDTEVSPSHPPPPPPPLLSNLLHDIAPSAKQYSEKDMKRINLLDQISAGIKLNPVAKTTRSNSKASIEDGKGLDALIMDALARFREDISFSDDEEDHYTDDGSEWSSDE